ncbi:HSP90 family protein [Nocardia sp. CDC159]|uniref:HSP90 family protein n=1 Tax=Nocardia pulmonis TaxID=2951408 RepID=A0A9X2IVE1_9NOCA|nr:MULTISPECIES: HSP90 family protein [Nocardia]MCM6773123.1 HSP90 family protein [Nocardia pulmonis]MCM6785574.1 HSP90 family protein [Nocardia sp. CDC159]
MEQAFQVDLRGIVDLLSHHLYGSPRVYVRELLQNAVDAVTARRELAAEAPGRVWIETAATTGDGSIRVHDNGIGLSEPEVHALLATIGRSGKRDDLGFARHEFLGQFGIGLLSCFLVADQVRVLTRSARGGATVAWTGSADGRYRVAAATEQRAEPGTTVILAPRQGMEQWVAGDTVTELAGLFGGLLPLEVTVDGCAVTAGELPWRAAHSTPAERGAALSAYAEQTFGFTPLATIDLSCAEAGLTGVAFVLPHPANPAARAGHRVYLKRMLIAEAVPGLLPDWAFFVRCVVDSTELRPTASREALYEDDLLEATREAVGGQLRDWLVELSASDPGSLATFLRIHDLGVKALALHDDDMLRLVDRWLPVETNAGRIPLAEFRRRFGTSVRYTPAVEEFRQLSAVAAAQGLGLVNGGYTYISEILDRLSRIDPDVLVERLDPSELATRFDLLDPVTELALRPLLDTAQRALDRLDCEVVLRAYDPPSLAALYLLDRETQHRAELRATRALADDLWSDVLAAFDTGPGPDRPQLVLNHRNPLVRRISGITEPRLATMAIEALYVQALLLGQHPLRPADTALLNRSFAGLLDWAVHDTEGHR